MSEKVSISALFPKHLFWDFNYSQLSIEEDMDVIVPRALYNTTEESFNDDISKLETLYSKDHILNELKSTTELISNEVCRLVAQRYNVRIFYRFKK